MESWTTLICPFLLLSHLPLYSTTTTDHVPVTGFLSTTNTTEPMGTLYPSLDSDITTNDVANATGAECLIDNKTAMVAVASAGGVIVCLLVSTLVLAWQLRSLQRRIARLLRRSHGNMDTGSSTWPLLGPRDPSDPPEAEGLEGPCDASVALEEMRPAAESDATKGKTQKERELEHGVKKVARHPEHMQSDARLDSQDLQNMPLVV